MLHISKRSEYGVHLLAYIADNHGGQPISTAKAAQELDLPYRFLSQIASDLKKAGVLLSKEGVKGGYSLNKAAADVTVKEVIQILDGPIGIVDCCRGKPCDKSDSCTHKDTFSRISHKLGGILEEYTIEHFRQPS